MGCLPRTPPGPLGQLIEILLEEKLRELDKSEIEDTDDLWDRRKTSRIMSEIQEYRVIPPASVELERQSPEGPELFWAADRIGKSRALFGHIKEWRGRQIHHPLEVGVSASLSLQLTEDLVGVEVTPHPASDICLIGIDPN